MNHPCRASLSLLFTLTLSVQAIEMSRPKPEPAPRITALSQNCVQRGTTTEIVISGESLKSATAALLVPKDGITAELVRDGNTLKLKLSADAGAALDERELRLQTPSGISNPVAMGVTSFAVASEKENNNAFASAQSIPLPASLSGAIQSAGDVDCFRFNARKGDAYVFDVIAARSGSKLDSSLTLLDEKGNELAHNEDGAGVDAVLTFNAPADGAYVLLLRDTRYQGGGDFAYRLNAGPLPYVESFFPMGGQRGQKVAVALSGRNLGGAETMSVELGADEKTGPRELRGQSPLGPGNAVQFMVGDLPEALEQEPNNAKDQAAAVAFPITYNGRIGKAGDIDMLRFKAEKDGPLSIELYAAAGGSQLDVLLTLMNADGGTIAQNDDLPVESRGLLDARIDFKDAKKDKEYLVAVRDLHDRGGLNFAYRLSIRPPVAPEPDFAVRFLPDTVTLCRGSHAKVWAEVTRKGGFDGDVMLGLLDLPQGISCEPVPFTSKPAVSGLFAISANADAQIGTYPLTLVASGTMKGKPATRIAQAELNGETVRGAYLTVLDKPPFTVELPRIETAEAQAKYKGEIAELEKKLNADSPELNARLAAWEKGDAGGASWVVLEANKLISAAYAKTEKQPDGAILVSGSNPVKDTYKLIIQTPLRGITAFQLEALPHPTLPGNGPGRAENGNFVLTHFKVDAAGANDPNNIKPIQFAKATADFSQDGFPVENSLKGDAGQGWAVSPQLGKAHTAIYACKDPIDYEGGTILTIALDHASQHAKHTLGHFRVSATTAKNPGAGKVLPSNVRVALDTTSDKRTDAQKKELLAYYRTQDSELAGVRNRLQELKSLESSNFPPNIPRNKAVDMPIVVRRAPGFTGDITLTVEGFSTGRDPKTKMPKALSENVESKPVILKGLDTLAVFNLKAKDRAEEGTRTILVKAESVHAGRLYAEYSPPIALTVSNVGKALNAKPLEAVAVKSLAPGLDVHYYEGEYQALPDFSKLKPAKSATAAKIDLAPAARGENYALKFEGIIDITVAGVYTFYTASDDGSKLYVGGQEVVSNDGPHAEQEMSGQVQLKRGAHTFVVTYFQGGGGAALKALYEGPNISKQTIPDDKLFHEKK